MDVVDLAQQQEAMARDLALQAQQARYQMTEDQWIDENGVVLCLDCEAAIDPDRLAVLPVAVRCVGCQEAAELLARCGR